MILPVQAGVSILGISFDPALLAFIILFAAFAILNFIDKKRID